jgi:hypothetical protein
MQPRRTERSGPRDWCWPGRPERMTQSVARPQPIPGRPLRPGQSGTPGPGNRASCGRRKPGTGTRQPAAPACSQHRPPRARRPTRCPHPHRLARIPHSSLAQPSGEAKEASQRNGRRATTTPGESDAAPSPGTPAVHSQLPAATSLPDFAAAASGPSAVHGGEQLGVGPDQQRPLGRDERAGRVAALLHPLVRNIHRARTMQGRRPQLGLRPAVDLGVQP